MPAEKIAETKFDAQVVREYSSTPHVDRLGLMHNTATLYKTGPDKYFVEWLAGDLDTVGIGIWTEEKKIVDYDGVFDIPREIKAFLRKQGFRFERDPPFEG